jgi:DNA-binding PadR family transcriptional regulator
MSSNPAPRSGETNPPLSFPGQSSPPPWEPPSTVPAGLPGSFEERVRLSIKVVVLLDHWGPPDNNGSARREMTQQGLAETLSVTQGAISKVLIRLAAADVVRTNRRHVAGLARRVRVYSLTRDGERLAREIRSQFGLPSPRPWQS